MSEENNNTVNESLYDVTMKWGDASLRVRCTHELPAALEGFKQFLAMLPARQSRANNPAPVDTESELDKLRAFYAEKTGKRFRATSKATGEEEIRAWFASQPDTVKAEFGGEESAPDAPSAEIPDMSETDAEAHL